MYERSAPSAMQAHQAPDDQKPLATPDGHVLAPAPAIGPYRVWASEQYRVITRPRARIDTHVKLLRLADRCSIACATLEDALATIDRERAGGAA